MNIILADQNYELTELAKAIANSPDDLFYVVKKIDGKDVSFAITREQLLSGISGGGSESKFIISGGAFWTGTGMDFDVSAVEYNYFGSVGITAPTTITLDNGDSDERFDIIVVNADTNSIEVVKGIPGSPAAFPEIAENQITLQPVLVSAGATTPNIINEPIYLNDAEWTATTYGGGTGTINFQSPIDPYEGAFCIEAINPVSLGMNFKYNGGTIDLQDFPFLTFFIKLDAPLTGSKAIYAFVGVGGVKKGLTISLKNSVDNNLVGAWQQVTVATSIFNAHVPIDFLRLVLAGSGPTIKYYMDMIVLSSGIDGGNVQADKITVQDGGASIGTRPKLNFVEGANVSLNIADDPVNDRVNIEISSVGGGGGITESDVKNTTRTYTKAQQITEVALTISGGNVAVNVGDSNAFKLNASGDYKLQNPTGLLANSGASWYIAVEVTGAGGWASTYDTSYVSVDGSAPPDIPNQAGDKFIIFMQTSTFYGKTVVSIYADSGSGGGGGGGTPNEEAIQGTAIYNGAMTGTVNLDLSTFTDVYGILTGNTTITVSETPAAGKSFVRSATIKSTAAESLTLPVGWIVKGAYKADGTENDLEIKFTNYPSVGLKIWCYINGAT